MFKRARLGRMALLLPVFFLILTTIYLAEATNIRTQVGGESIVGPAFMPVLVSILMYAALLVVIVGELRREEDVAGAGSFVRPMLVVIATGLYIAAFRPFGYIPSTAVFVAALFLIFDFERGRPALLALYVIGVTVVFYGLFAGIFGVRLPPAFGGF